MDSFGSRTCSSIRFNNTEEKSMQPRMDYQKASPSAVRALYAVSMQVQSGLGLDPKLLSLLELRASQLNGCAFCIDMHSKDARALGESEQRLYALNAWRETPFFSEPERAVLAWTEAVTNVQQGHVPTDVFEEMRKHFADAQIVNLTLAIAVINAWNRMGIAFRAVPGAYQPSTRQVQKTA
jgi:AhpD family alkylhydroperoxidase